jgi:hypothetical protein
MSNQLIEYMGLHLLSLEQDREKLSDEMDLFEEQESNEFRSLDYEYNQLIGQIEATRHLLSVAQDIMEA